MLSQENSTLHNSQISLAIAKKVIAKKNIVIASVGGEFVVRIAIVLDVITVTNSYRF